MSPSRVHLLNFRFGREPEGDRDVDVGGGRNAPLRSVDAPTPRTMVPRMQARPGVRQASSVGSPGQQPVHG